MNDCLILYYSMDSASHTVSNTEELYIRKTSAFFTNGCIKNSFLKITGSIFYVINPLSFLYYISAKSLPI